MMLNLFKQVYGTMKEFLKTHGTYPAVLLVLLFFFTVGHYIGFSDGKNKEQLKWRLVILLSGNTQNLKQFVMDDIKNESK